MKTKMRHLLLSILSNKKPAYGHRLAKIILRVYMQRQNKTSPSEPSLSIHMISLSVWSKRKLLLVVKVTGITHLYLQKSNCCCNMYHDSIFVIHNLKRDK